MGFKQKGFPMHKTASALKQKSPLHIHEPWHEEEPIVETGQEPEMSKVVGTPPEEFEISQRELVSPERKLASEAQEMLEMRGFQDIDPNSPGFKGWGKKEVGEVGEEVVKEKEEMGYGLPGEGMRPIKEDIFSRYDSNVTVDDIRKTGKYPSNRSDEELLDMYKMETLRR